MKNYLRSLSTVLLAAGLAGIPAVRADSPWSVRLAATYLETVDGSTNKAVPVEVEDKLIPEFDISYAFTSNWSADLVLTIPQKHDVSSAGANIGDFKHLPPTLLGKYTFNPIGRFRPYVGAGVNFTLIFDENLAGGLKLDSYSIGPAGQVGFDYALNDKWALNLDVKRMMLRTDVRTSGGAKVTELHLDPWLYSLGLRHQF
jgi:outer membrane protein